MQYGIHLGPRIHGGNETEISQAKHIDLLGKLVMVRIAHHLSAPSLQQIQVNGLAVELVIVSGVTSRCYLPRPLLIVLPEDKHWLPGPSIPNQNIMPGK